MFRWGVSVVVELGRASTSPPPLPPRLSVHAASSPQVVGFNDGSVGCYSWAGMRGAFAERLHGTSPVLAARISADGDTILSGDESGRVLLNSLSRRYASPPAARTRSPVQALALEPNWQRAAGTSPASHGGISPAFAAAFDGDWLRLVGIREKPSGAAPGAAPGAAASSSPPGPIQLNKTRQGLLRAIEWGDDGTTLAAAFAGQVEVYTLARPPSPRAASHDAAVAGIVAKKRHVVYPPAGFTGAPCLALSPSCDALLVGWDDSVRSFRLHSSAGQASAASGQGAAAASPGAFATRGVTLSLPARRVLGVCWFGRGAAAVLSRDCKDGAETSAVLHIIDVREDGRELWAERIETGPGRVLLASAPATSAGGAGGELLPWVVVATVGAAEGVAPSVVAVSPLSAAERTVWLLSQPEHADAGLAEAAAAMAASAGAIVAFCAAADDLAAVSARLAALQAQLQDSSPVPGRRLLVDRQDVVSAFPARVAALAPTVSSSEASAAVFLAVDEAEEVLRGLQRRQAEVQVRHSALRSKALMLPRVPTAVYAEAVAQKCSLLLAGEGGAEACAACLRQRVTPAMLLAARLQAQAGTDPGAAWRRSDSPLMLLVARWAERVAASEPGGAGLRLGAAMLPGRQSASVAPAAAYDRLLEAAVEASAWEEAAWMLTSWVQLDAEVAPAGAKPGGGGLGHAGTLCSAEAVLAACARASSSPALERGVVHAVLSVGALVAARVGDASASEGFLAGLAAVDAGAIEAAGAAEHRRGLVLDAVFLLAESRGIHRRPVASLAALARLSPRRTGRAIARAVASKPDDAKAILGALAASAVAAVVSAPALTGDASSAPQLHAAAAREVAGAAARPEPAPSMMIAGCDVSRAVTLCKWVSRQEPVPDQDAPAAAVWEACIAALDALASDRRRSRTYARMGRAPALDGSESVAAVPALLPDRKESAASGKLQPALVAAASPAPPPSLSAALSWAELHCLATLWTAPHKVGAVVAAAGAAASPSVVLGLALLALEELDDERLCPAAPHAVEAGAEAAWFRQAERAMVRASATALVALGRVDEALEELLLHLGDVQEAVRLVETTGDTVLWEQLVARCATSSDLLAQLVLRAGSSSRLDVDLSSLVVRLPCEMQLGAVRPGLLGVVAQDAALRQRAADARNIVGADAAVLFRNLLRAADTGVAVGAASLDELTGERIVSPPEQPTDAAASGSLTPQLGTKPHADAWAPGWSLTPAQLRSHRRALIAAGEGSALAMMGGAIAAATGLVQDDNSEDDGADKGLRLLAARRTSWKPSPYDDEAGPVSRLLPRGPPLPAPAQAATGSARIRSKHAAIAAARRDPSLDAVSGLLERPFGPQETRIPGDAQNNGVHGTAHRGAALGDGDDDDDHQAEDGNGLLDNGERPQQRIANRSQLALTVCFSRDAYRKWQRERLPAARRGGRDRSASTASDMGMPSSRQNRGSSATRGAWGSESPARRDRISGVPSSAAGSEMVRQQLQQLASTTQVVVANPIAI